MPTGTGAIVYLGAIAVAFFSIAVNQGLKMNERLVAALFCYAAGFGAVTCVLLIWVQMGEPPVNIQRAVLGILGAAIGACLLIALGEIIRPGSLAVGQHSPTNQTPLVGSSSTEGTSQTQSTENSLGKHAAATKAEEPKAVVSGPIAWEPGPLDSVVQVENSPSNGAPVVTLIKMYHAKNTSTEPLVGVRAYVTPQLNRADLPMVFYDAHHDVSKKTSIKPGEEFYLYYDLRPSSADKEGLPLQDYLDSYGGITITLEADSKVVFQKSFAYSDIKQMLDTKLDQYLANQRLR